MNKDLKFLASILDASTWPKSLTYVRLDADGEICFSSGITKYDFYPDDLDTAKAVFVPAHFDAKVGSAYSLQDILDAHSELGITQSAEPTENAWRWPEDGLPQVGTVLEAWFDDRRRCWHKAYVVGYHPSEENTLAVSLIGDHESRLIWSDISGIRPIRSEEDKAVEKMLALDCDSLSRADFCRALYRAGYHKQETK
jgi:hypothetical protein